MLRVGIAFGGVSVEHEVSVISGLQVAAALDAVRYEPVPVYIGKDGSWYTGTHLLDVEQYRDLPRAVGAARRVMPRRASGGGLELVETDTPWWMRKATTHAVDVLFLALHGSEGENGAMQGLCEVFNVPYTGSGVLGSALGMDKAVAKMLAHDQGIPILDFQVVREATWVGAEEACLTRLESEIGFPVVVKPARLGSSVGIARANSRSELDAAIEEALRYDEKILVERAVTELREVNCSVRGTPQQASASVLEEPVRAEGSSLLSYHDKYERGSGSKAAKSGPESGASSGQEGMASMERRIPADVPEETEALVKDLALRVFRLFECAGVARIDFLIDAPTGSVYFNEINTIPGSFSFYLWEPCQVPFDELVGEMIDVAMRQHRDRNARVRSFDSNLLALPRLQGAKGKGR